MSIGTRLHTLLFGRLVGSDRFGNRYYEDRRRPDAHRGSKHGGGFGHSYSMTAKRWVMYKGIAEASKVPAEWHGWLHYTAANPPVTQTKQYDWQQEHLPNLTGTKLAYRPSGHLLKGAKRTRALSDYEAWKP